jgi:DNA-binding CsgD family transcriptional regulator
VITKSEPNTRPGADVSGPACGLVHAWRSLGPGADRSAPDRTIVEAALHLLAENFEQGLAVTDLYGRARFLNRTARAFISRGLLRVERGGLRGTTPEDSAALRRTIACCAAGQGGRSVRLEGDGGTLLIAACAITEDAVLLRLIDPAAARLPSAGVLQDQFGFTPAEAALAVDILAGNDLTASATRRRITRNTARVHLRRLFAKTGTRRQAELMRLLLLCPQPLAATEGSLQNLQPLVRTEDARMK